MTIGRPRIRNAVLSAALEALYLFLVFTGVVTGMAGLLIVGLIMTVVGALVIHSIMRTLIVLDGSVVHSRFNRGWTHAVDLDRVSSVDVELVGAGPAPAFMTWRYLVLRTEDDPVVRISATAVRTDGVFRELAARIDAGTTDPEFTKRARKLLERARRDAPRPYFGPT